MLKIDKPRDRDIHSLADFVELFCLQNLDQTCSQDTIVDFLTENDYAVSEDNLFDCFDNISWRLNAFSDSYPFRLLNDRVIIAHEQLTNNQKLYILLLYCANLPYFDQALRSTLTSSFEGICFFAIKNFWPASGVVRKFGVGNSDYEGSKLEKLTELSKNIGGDPSFHQNTFRQHDNGDAGIDLVAWLDFDSSETRNKLSFLVQCACSRSEWSSKQSEVSHERLDNIIRSSAPWNVGMFIPQCFRNNHGKWAVSGDVNKVLLFDRLRIFKLLLINFLLENIVPPCFEAILNSRMSLV